jgi:hypothetical protein
LRFVARLGSALALVGCAAAPPRSRFPTADDALERMRATSSCSRGVQGESKVDYFGQEGRLRASLLFVASRPERVRFDVVSPFGVTLSTLTSDGRWFSLFDIGHKEFFEGPASVCTLARFLQVPVAPHALVALLGGEAPVLVHGRDQVALAWEAGEYVVRIQSAHDASEVIELAPRPDDWSIPWQSQRLRVSSVAVRQRGVELYRAELSDFEVTHTAAPRRDPDGIDPDIPPSGPPCDAEVPRRVRIVSEATGRDVLLQHHELFHNPPLLAGVFVQARPPGVRRVKVDPFACH